MDSGKQSRRAVLAAGVSGLAAGMIANGWTPARAAAPEAAGQASGGQGDPLPPVLKVSIAAYSFRADLDEYPGKRGKMSLFDLADMAVRWRIDAIEPTSYYFLRDDDEYIYSLKAKIFRNGLDISGTPVRNNFCLPPGPELKKEIETLKKWVDICVKLGSPAIRVFAGRPDPNRSREQIFKTLVDAMKEAAEYAQSRGIFLGLENHGFMTETADDVLRIVDAVKNDWMAVNLDSGNFKTDGYAQIAKLAPRAVICQMKTLVSTPDGKRVPVDVPRFMQILRDAKYRGYVALEFEEKKDPHEEVPVWLKKMQDAIRA
ncbi:MAG TPA: sugar phosphate isomerase/epimerase family protein [Phycisphaerae bacterium]|jgi:sugar phosphate isomerase/epimerase|nr:sugar phosphate isomerase/epimerase [Phycisphaerae bacterium]HOB75197.1 sugar phosphate isomerase/epimerase family protein [Phycisphaerae bacterium]HOJ54678.1 sugar phosphate isomerase/epimerase family protein [Phycisphaerae bacterium]HOL25972.1 sugar phosphate isomerase/epimerase family protein [Phycisphaerae bacterium]HPP19456.1 sugar phosphate isomerase/epimerase family protein [Phycisphaerae bacterium]